MEKNPIQESPAQEKTGLPQNQTYEQLFLDTHNMHKRGEKSTYVRPEYHDRLSRIAHVVGDHKIPLYAYPGNILTHHFEQFEQAIIEDYRRKIKPIL